MMSLSRNSAPKNCGLTINKCYLAFINNQYVRQGEIDPAQLFTIQDITAEAASRR